MADGAKPTRALTLNPKVRKFLDQRTRDRLPSPHEQDYAKARIAFDSLQAEGWEQAPGIIEDLSVETELHGNIRIRIIRSRVASEASPIVIYLHGGAWVAGNVNAYDRVLQNIAIEAETAVVFVDFTLAPEASYATQIEQSYAALCWIVNEASRLKLDGLRVALVGDSSGGNMAAILTLMAKQRRFPDIALQVLLYPIIATPSEHSIDADRELVTSWFTTEALRSRLSCVFPDHSSWNVTAALPFDATSVQLNDLPEALVVVAEHDIARDGAEQYARHLTEAGVDVTCTRYNGVIHDFMFLNALSDAAPARSAWEQVVSTLRSALRERAR